MGKFFNILYSFTYLYLAKYYLGIYLIKYQTSPVFGWLLYY